MICCVYWPSDTGIGEYFENFDRLKDFTLDELVLHRWKPSCVSKLSKKRKGI